MGETDEKLCQPLYNDVDRPLHDLKFGDEKDSQENQIHKAWAKEAKVMAERLMTRGECLVRRDVMLPMNSEESMHLLCLKVAPISHVTVPGSAPGPLWTFCSI